LPRLQRQSIRLQPSAAGDSCLLGDDACRRIGQLFVAPTALVSVAIRRVVHARAGGAIDQVAVQRPEPWPVAAIAQVGGFVQQRAHDRAAAAPARAVTVGRAANRDLGHVGARAPDAATVGGAQTGTRADDEVGWQPLATEDRQDRLAQLREQSCLRRAARSGQRHQPTVPGRADATAGCAPTVILSRARSS